MIKNDWIDHSFIEKYTVGFAEVAASVKEWTLERTAKIAGIAEKGILQAAEWWGTAKTSFLMHARGIEQRSQVAHYSDRRFDIRARVAPAASRAIVRADPGCLRNLRLYQGETILGCHCVQRLFHAGICCRSVILREARFSHTVTSFRCDGGERIVDAALQLFRDRGFDQTTMRDIAAEADVATGAAYYYFRSKEDGDDEEDIFLKKEKLLPCHA